MAKSKLPAWRKVLDQFIALPKDEQLQFVQACMERPGLNGVKDAIGGMAVKAIWAESAGFQSALEHPKIAPRLKMIRDNQTRTGPRDDRIRELRDKHGLGFQDIYDKHQDELRTLNGGKKVGIETVKYVYYDRGKKRGKRA